jgi:prolyl oligopeptidase
VHRRLSVLCLLLAACGAPESASLAVSPSPKLPSVKAPPTATGSQVDDYAGTRVADPYRWLEDDNSPETAAWVAAQNAVTEKALAALPQRDALHARLADLWNVPRLSGLRVVGKAYAWSRNDGLAAQDSLVVGDQPATGGRVLLDPSAWSKDGTVALAGVDWSDDGTRAVYSVSDAGSDWRTLKVVDVATGKDTGDEIHFVKFSTPTWAPDGHGFWYGRFPEPAPGEAMSGANVNAEVRFHKLGEPQSADKLVYSDPAHPEWNFTMAASDDGRWLVRTTWYGAANREQLHVRPLDAPDGAAWTTIDDGFDIDVNWLGDDGDVHYVLTRLDAPRGRVVAVDLAHPGRADWKELVPQTADTLQSAALFGDTLVLQYLRDAHDVVVLRSLRDGRDRELELPGVGSVTGFFGHRQDKETFFEYASFTEPTSVWRLTLPDGHVERVWRAPVHFDPDAFVAEQVWYPSKDGTKIPMFLVHGRDVKADGNRPVVLYGYGGFDISLTPGFRADMIPLLERGAVWAQPSLRGGGEYGEPWHEAGMLGHKQNVFDDFIGAAEWLVQKGWTRPGRIVIHGRSNGGLLVGAALTQRPELWGCALPAVGVMDMLRFQRFTVGSKWVPEYGSSDDPAAFRWLYAYSPLHNIKPGTVYPPTLVMTADHDDRVVPAHSFKFAAALQAAQAGPAPVLARIESRAGHGSGRPVEYRIAEAADMWAFALAALGER